jgi:hypothetical protein
MVYFQTKNPKFGNFFEGNRRCLVYFSQFGIFYGYLVYFMVIWYIMWLFGIFYGHLVYYVVIWSIFSVLVCCSKKNLATLPRSRVAVSSHPPQEQIRV